MRKFSELFVHIYRFKANPVLLLLNHPFSISSSEEKRERKLTNKNRNRLPELSSFLLIVELKETSIRKKRTNTFRRILTRERNMNHKYKRRP